MHLNCLIGFNLLQNPQQSAFYDSFRTELTRKRDKILKTSSTIYLQMFNNKIIKFFEYYCVKGAVDRWRCKLTKRHNREKFEMLYTPGPI